MWEVWVAWDFSPLKCLQREEIVKYGEGRKGGGNHVTPTCKIINNKSKSNHPASDEERVRHVKGQKSYCWGVISELMVIIEFLGLSSGIRETRTSRTS